jgi:hypothetical protein
MLIAESRASSLQRRFSQVPFPLLAFLVICLAILKCGISINPLTPEPLSDFPTPRPGYAALSYGLRSLAWMLQMEGPSAYVILGLCLTAIAFVFIPWAARRAATQQDARLLMVLIILGPIGVVLLNNLGRHDVLVILGGLALGFLGRNWRWALAGAAVMVLGNPEQAVVASAVLLLLTFSRELRPWRAGAVIALSISSVAFIVLSTWAAGAGVGSRATFVGGLLGNSIYQFFGNFPLSLYAGYGVIWIVILWSLFQARTPLRWLILICLILIPAAMTAITLDQTRVFVGVSTGAVTAVLVAFVPLMRAAAEAAGYRNTLSWTLACAAFLPAFEIWSTGYVRMPYGQFFSDVLPHIKSFLIG